MKYKCIRNYYDVIGIKFIEGKTYSVGIDYDSIASIIAEDGYKINFYKYGHRGSPRLEDFFVSM